MQCQNCHATLAPSATVCPTCGRFVDARIERLIDRIAAEIAANSLQAEATFSHARNLIVPQDEAHLRQRVREQVNQLPQSVPSPDVDQTLVAASLPLADPARHEPPGGNVEQTLVTPSSSAPETGPVSPPAPAASPPQPAGSPPRAVAVPPPRRPVPPGDKGNRAVYMDFNQSPREIVRVMHETQEKASHFKTQRKRWLFLFLLLFPAGLPFLCLDVAMGYNIFTFSIVTLTLWLGAIFGLILLRRRQRAPEIGPRFGLARTIFDTLKDDVAPKRTLVGWLDLTGAEQESKIIRQKKSRSGQPIKYYRDEWLKMKTRLYDGSVLRVSVVERVKARQGYWKRGRTSGKQKYRSGSSESRHELNMSVSPNPEAYGVVSFRETGPIPNSRFVIRQAEASGGRIVLSAAAPDDFDAWDILNALRFGYDHLQPRQDAGSQAAL